MIAAALALSMQVASVPAEVGAVVAQTDAVQTEETKPEEAQPPACAPGIYAESGAADAATLLPIARVTMEKRQVTNLGGFLLTGGLSGLRVKQVLPGPAASVRLATSRPAFRFCFEPPASATATGDGSAYVGATRTAASPAEYRLVLFDAKREQRELVIARTRMLAGIRGTMADASLRFQSQEIAPGQYRVTLDYDLPPGEFGFLLAAGGGDYRANQNQASAGSGGAPQGEVQVYDFAVIREPTNR